MFAIVTQKCNCITDQQRAFSNHVDLITAIPDRTLDFHSAVVPTNHLGHYV